MKLIMILNKDYQTVLPYNDGKHERPHAENIVSLSNMMGHDVLKDDDYLKPVDVCREKSCLKGH